MNDADQADNANIRKDLEDSATGSTSTSDAATGTGSIDVLEESVTE